MTVSTRIDPRIGALLADIERRFLVPQDSEIRKREQQARKLIAEINRRNPIISVKEVLDHGSLSRGTGLHNFLDLDKLVVLDPVAFETQRGTRRKPVDALARFAAEIRDRRSGLIQLENIQVRRQRHSVGVKYLQSNFRIDLVPALRERGKILIPEIDTGDWIPIHSKAVETRLRLATAKQPHTIAAIRLLKGWLRARGALAPFPSFAIETLVVDLALRSPMPLEQIIDGFFATVGGTDARHSLTLGSWGTSDDPVTLIDPVTEKNLAEELTRKQCSTLIKTARKASRKLREISKLVNRGSLRSAQVLARDYFVGPKWL